MTIKTINFINSSTITQRCANLVTPLSFILFINFLKKANNKILYTFLFFFFLSEFSFAQSNNEISSNLYPSIINKNLFEVNKIIFIGSSEKNTPLLYDIITSKATNNNLPYQFFVMYFREFEKNPVMPKALQSQFRKGLINLRDNVLFFEKSIADGDLTSLYNFYQINGYHTAKINYRFIPSPNKIENILEFKIHEGNRFRIDSIIYNGFETIDKELENSINSLKFVKKNYYFDELQIYQEVKNINKFLKDNGYLYSTYSQPKVEIDTENYTDKVIIDFNPGKRYKINRIDFIDSSAKNQPPIASEMKRMQLEFKVGDWASEKAINNTKDNLLSLGTFEIVAIDTSSRFSQQKDSLLNIIVFLLYRKEQEFNFGLSLNQTRIDNLVNFGVETSYRHRNIFNAAQEFSPYANVYLKDLGTVFSNQNYEFEMQLGFKFAQPLLWVIDNSRVAFLTSLNYSYRMFNNYFKISSFNLPVSFPIKFPKITYFNRASVDFNFLREDPVNFEEAKFQAYESAKTANDSNNVLQSFILYQDLWNYLHQGQFYLFTSNTIGLSISGDTRNNPFSPSQGYYTMLSLDGWNPLFFPSTVSGLSRFLRFQLTNYQFFKLTPTTVLALKGKIGAINLLQRDNSYVPIDRLFFCGGPNSVRAWPSRQLRYTKFTQDSLQNSRTYSFLENFVGNGVLVEGSIELRFGFPKPPGLNKALQEAIQNIKTTLFLDFGNAFHWYVNTDDYQVSFLDYIIKLAVGTGIGIRYETPIGPLRLDFAFPVYDPLKIRKPFSTMQFNFGIGHAF